MSKDKIDSIASEITEAFVKQLHEQIAKQVAADVAQKLAQIDINKTVQFYIDRKLTDFVKKLTFPAGSIPAEAINFQNFKMSGDNVISGIIKSFGSTGIQDNASTCQVTIMDQATVVENQLVTSAATIKGNLTVEGDLKLLGEIPTDSPFYKDLVEHSAGLLKLSMDGEFFLAYADKVFEKIKADGLDLTKLTINGTTVLSGNKLGSFVTETNIQELGELRSLTVNGDAILNKGSLTVVNKRVGVNTETPAGALAVWDEECEVVTRKLRKDVAIFGTMRPQRLVVSSNGRNNIVVEPDGSVGIEQLTIGGVQITSSDERPRHEAKQGTIVLNERPDHGKPMFWMSIGGANWANGPIVE